jgi:hypothetical protein
MLEEAFDSLYKSKVHSTWWTIYHKRWKMNNKNLVLKHYNLTKNSSSMYHKRWKNELQNQVLKHYDLTKKTPSAKRIVLDEKDEKWTTKPSFETLQSHKRIKFNVP